MATLINQSFILHWTPEILFIQKHFAGQTNKSGIPHWLHSVDVMQRTQLALQVTTPVNTQLLKQASLIALGHDLLEDTTLSTSELEKRWGVTVVESISVLTKKAADGEDAHDYFAQLLEAGELVRLVKIADIWSNVSTSLMNVESLDPQWMKTVWLPLLKGYTKLYNLPWKELKLPGEFITKHTRANHDKLIDLWQTRGKDA